MSHKMRSSRTLTPLISAGFFYVTGTPLQQELIDQAFEVHRQYFHLPEEEKMKLPRVDWDTQKYYGHNASTKSGGEQDSPACCAG